MLAIPVDTSSQAPYRLISVQARKIAHFTAPPFPKKSGDFSGTLCDRAAFLCSRLLPYLPLPAEKKILCPCTSVLDMISSFVSDIQKSRHTTSRMAGIPLLSNIAMLCNGFEFKTFAAYTNREKQHTPRLRSALCHRLTFKQIALCDFQFSSNSLSGILEYHSGDMAVKILHKLLVYPVDRDFIHLP